MKIKSEIVKKALLLQLKGTVTQIGDGTSKMGFIYEVEDNTVRIYKKKGRTEINCSCSNCSRFCNSNTLCSFKLAAIMEYIKIFN